MNKPLLRKVSALIVLGAVCPLAPAHAVMLEQKWQAGQNLSYQTEINGTANVQAPADANFLLAGVPLEVEISGKGLAEIQTLKVDDKGVGTIAVRVPKFDLNAQSMGQRGQITLLDATSKITMNGKPLKMGDGTNPLATPLVAVSISRDGHFVGVESLQPKTAAPAPQNVPANAAPAKPVDMKDAIDKGALVIAAVTRALPALWPGRDVQNGETWKANLAWPTPVAGDPKKTEMTQFGEWNLTLKGEETVNGRVLQRVGLEGTLNVDSAQLMLPEQTTPANPTAAPRFAAKAKQDVKGDVWLDAAAGQIVRADMVLGARVDAGMGKEEKGQGWADFTGSLLLNLKDVA